MNSDQKTFNSRWKRGDRAVSPSTRCVPVFRTQTPLHPVNQTCVSRARWTVETGAKRVESWATAWVILECVVFLVQNKQVQPADEAGSPPPCWSHVWSSFWESPNVWNLHSDIVCLKCQVCGPACWLDRGVCVCVSKNTTKRLCLSLCLWSTLFLKWVWFESLICSRHQIHFNYLPTLDKVTPWFCVTVSNPPLPVPHSPSESLLSHLSPNLSLSRYLPVSPALSLPLRSLRAPSEWQIWFVVQTARGRFCFTGSGLFQLDHDSDRCSVIWESTPPQKGCFRVSQESVWLPEGQILYVGAAGGCRDVTTYAKSGCADTVYR